jgi:hypothetical protein
MNLYIPSLSKYFLQAGARYTALKRPYLFMRVSAFFGAKKFESAITAQTKKNKQNQFGGIEYAI